VVYAETGNARYVVASPFARPALAQLPDLTVLAFESYGFAPGLSRGVTPDKSYAAGVLNVCRELDISSAAVPPDFPLEVADELRASGIELSADREEFDGRRRVKTEAQLNGIRRAQKAAETAMGAIRDQIQKATSTTSEELRELGWGIFVEHGCAPNPKLTIASGERSGLLHEAGSGPIQPHQPILVDVYPQELQSGCWGDISRTFCKGEPPPELSRMHSVVCTVLEEVKGAIRPGTTGHELAAIAHAAFTDAGYSVGPSSPNGQDTATFPHILGHGLGLELHERPFLDAGGEPLVAGDVVTVEPGLYQPGWGGVRMEDVVLVQPGGNELITRFPYDLSI
jgi:Xaa-Pro aminopeptidase